MSAEVVGPLPTVTFRGGPDRADRQLNRPKAAYVPPTNTMDPRYAACTDHHVACDCREAEFAEDRQEFLAHMQEIRRAVAKVLAGHPTFVFHDGGEAPGCMCTGCQIVRAAHLSNPDGWVSL